MVEELLEKIPTEKCWAITAKMLLIIYVLRGMKYILPLLGKGEGILAPVLAREKYEEISEKIWGDGGRRLIPWVKETFNISVEDAIGAAKLIIVAAAIIQGPENEYEIVEKSKERAVDRTTKCAFMERFKEFEVDPEHMPCVTGCQKWVEEGLKAINTKINFKRAKAMPWGDPYCDFVYEFKEE